jgi:4-hydroxybenzoate polyprenyltransferase
MMSDSDQDIAVPLCVDLDGTLLLTDLLAESFFGLLRNDPFAALMTPFWLLKGRAHLKRQIAERSAIDPENLPYNLPMLDYLRQQKQKGRRLILATASDSLLAQRVADHLGIFDEVIASNGDHNLKARRKLAALEERFGAGKFDYAGDSSADMAIWERSRQAVVVGSASLAARVRAMGKPLHEIPRPSVPPHTLLRALRPHQWAKNALLLIPLILAHKVTDATRWIHLAWAILAFSLTASSIYIWNDLLDLAADRKHPRKRNRPFASGLLRIHQGVAMSATLALCGVAIAWALVSPRFLALLLLYLALTTAYSSYFKRKLLVDVLCLAGLYTLRIVAGGVAATVPVTPWLLAFSLFFFLSLAFAKRYTELSLMRDTPGKVSNRGYWAADLEMIGSMGPTSGFLSVLVLALYINGLEVRSLYGRPDALYFVCPVLLYWICRVWFLAHRDQLHDDPVLFALKDRNSLIAGVMVAIILLVATMK